MLGILSFLASLGLNHAKAQGDTTRYLLLNYALQMEITDAVDQMYNFNFHKAEVEFNWMKYRYPDHPLPYFLFAVSKWWQMLPYGYENEQLEEQFQQYIELTIEKAEDIYDADEGNIEAAFFMAGAYGFLGRYHSEKKNWLSAASVGKSSLNYLRIIQGNESFSPEILFGDALFNYYASWLRDEYPLLRPIMLFFPKGNMELGINQLETVSRNAFYTRIEAIYFLMRIRAYETKELGEALRLSETVHNKYPNNPYFHRFYTQMLYNNGRYNEALTESTVLLKRFEAEQLGYEEISAKYAHFFSGHILRGRGQHDEAQRHFYEAVRYNEMLGVDDSGYYLYAQYYLAEYELERGDYEIAMDRVKLIRKNTQRKETIAEMARDLQKQIRKSS